MKCWKTNCLSRIWVFCVFMIGILSLDVTSLAATTGTMPCMEGNVTWTLSDEGDLVLAGNGKVGFERSHDWLSIWRTSDLLIHKSDIRTFSVQEDSDIELTTIMCMFGYFDNCISIDLTGLHTNDVPYLDAGAMFSGCTALEEINWGNLDFSKVISMGQMFKGCSSLTELDLSGLDTSKVEQMCWMFEECSSLEKVDLSDLNLDEVITMVGMFDGCTSLKEVNLSGVETGKLKWMADMFNGCSSLRGIDLSDMDTGAVTYMDNMFNGCSSLTEINLSGFDTSSVTEMSNMFNDCSSLESLDLSSFNVATEDVLGTCTSLKEFTSAQGMNTYVLSTGGGLWYDDVMNIYDETESVVLNACTTIYKIQDFYNIDYVCEGELKGCPTTYTYARGVESLGFAELPCYTFDGWYLEESYKTQITSIQPGKVGDIVLYGKLTPNVYNIHYHRVENVVNFDDLQEQYTYGTQSRIPVLMRDCHIFKGWYLDSAYTKAFLGITPTTNGDLTLYAKWEEAHNYDMTNGKVLKEATATETGTIEYTCKNCAHKTTAVIPKLTVENVSEDTLSVTDETILDNKNDNDIKGSSFVMIQARADKVTKNSISLKWNKVKNADGYKIYGNKCGKKNRYKYIKTISNGKTTKFTQKKLKKGTYYKYIVRAYKLIDGQEVTIAASKTIHATTTGGKYGNAKSVKIKTDKKMKSKKGSYTLTIKKNKKYTIKASEVKQSKKIKKHRVIKFESSDASIATVNSKGSVKGIKKGTCYIYAYAQNGIYKKIKVKVK